IMQDKYGSALVGFLATVKMSHSVLMMTSTSQSPRAPRQNVQLLGPLPCLSSSASHSPCITRQARHPENNTPNRNLRAEQVVE
ncbi:hypothetical protein NL108_007344, partial [Boleophthalmus pectinirostris]